MEQIQENTAVQAVVKAVADDISHNRNFFSYERDNYVRAGDTVLFYESIENFRKMVMRHGDKYQNTKGVIPHSDIIDKDKFGTRIFTTNKRSFAWVIKPNTHAYTKSLAQRTQILYTPDISQVLMRL